MARKTSTSLTRRERSEIAASERVSPETRQRMIREAAYYRYVQRGYAQGHDVEDWLTAESAFERARWPRPQPQPATVAPVEFELQQSGSISHRADEALKRIARQHPRRDIPRVESIESDEDVPLRE